MQNQLLTSKNKHYNTPDGLLELIRKFGPIILDPCSNKDSIVNAKINFDGINNDGLKEKWHGLNGNEFYIIFCNPPYGRQQKKWINKCIDESTFPNDIFLLIPARSDTKAFQELLYPISSKICLIKGRLKFLNQGSKAAPAPFPSMLVYFGLRKNKFTRVFKHIGIILK